MTLGAWFLLFCVRVLDLRGQLRERNLLKLYTSQENFKTKTNNQELYLMSKRIDRTHPDSIWLHPKVWIFSAQEIVGRLLSGGIVLSAQDEQVWIGSTKTAWTTPYKRGPPPIASLFTSDKHHTNLTPSSSNQSTQKNQSMDRWVMAFGTSGENILGGSS